MQLVRSRNSDLRPELPALTRARVLVSDYWVFPLLLAAGVILQQADPTLFSIVTAALSDAYLGVSVYVAVTLSGFYLLQRRRKWQKVVAERSSAVLQVPTAALLGALPGCGGAIIVVTRFVQGRVSFGALVTVLITTMGDAAFLLLSREPATAVLVFCLAGVTGILSGYLIDAVHGRRFMSPVQALGAASPDLDVPGVPAWLRQGFWLLIVPGLVISLASLLPWQADGLAVTALEASAGLGVLGSLFCITVWAHQPLNSWTARFAQEQHQHGWCEAIVAETSFVSVWVIAGFVGYELLVHWTAVDLAGLFAQAGAWLPLVALLVGFVPGCGPQILVTTLYCNGVVPLSALLANAISNDGDALFPAIALAPRAAVAATLYSAIPALLVGYGAHFLIR